MVPRNRRISRITRNKETVMRRQSSSRKECVRFGWALVALVAATAVPITVIAADRMVLSEEFSSTT